MPTSSKFPLALTCALIACAAVFPPTAGAAESTTVPDVEFLVLRLDYLSYEVEGGYRFSQPYRKTLQPEGLVRAGNTYIQYTEACDFGSTEVRSRLTGQTVAAASTVWMGAGHWTFPDGVLMPMTTGGYAPDPDALDSFTPFGGNAGQVAAAWESARRVDALGDLFATGPYEVVILDHFYSVGGSVPGTAEWIVIALSHPQAPDDVGLVSMKWPYSVISLGLETAPQVTVCNFSDDPQTFGVSVRVERNGTTVHEGFAPAGTLAADASATLLLPSFAPETPESLLFTVEIVGESGEPWSDTFSDNDAIVRWIQVVAAPTFWPVASIRRPGPIPLDGDPVDIDGDGDIDVLRHGYHPTIWQRDSLGTYHDITDLTNVVLPPHPRAALAGDLTGDSHPELLITSFCAPPLLLRGDGTGAFTDMTVQAGLGSVIGYYDAEALDLENDGDPDLIFQSHGQETVLANDGSGHFTDVTAASGIADLAQTEDIAVGDVNADGATDIFLSNWSAASKLFVNDGQGHFAPVAGPWTEWYSRAALFLDCDGDSLQDIVWMRSLFEETSALFRNTGELQFEDVSEAWGIDLSAFGGDAADLDHDGLPEVLLTGGWGYALLSSDGTSFVDRTALIVNVDGAYSLSYDSPHFVDLNEDGLLDIYHRDAAYFQVGDALPLDPVPVEPDTPSAPRCTICLAKAWPNPFVPSVRGEAIVSFSMSRRAPVEIRLFDVKGRMVRRLFDGTVDAGVREVRWDGRDDAGRALPSGVYVGSIESGRARKGLRVVLLR